MTETPFATAGRYRKKPLVVEAFRYDGSNFEELLAWVDDPEDSVRITRTEHWDGACGEPQHQLNRDIYVGTLEDRGSSEGDGAQVRHVACPTDWIIRGVENELYPCKDRIFGATYEPVAVA